MSAAKLRALAETDVREPIPADALAATLQAAPFIYVPGTFNTRDLGQVPTASGSAPAVRPGFAFRSGALAGLQDAGKALLAGPLGIKTIFDLRSDNEHAGAPDPPLEGVENIWVRSAEQDAVVDLSEFVDGDGAHGYELMYLDVLDKYRDSFRRVLEHIRDKPQEPFLFHCTAGRDRTGVLSGLLLTLAGATPEDVTLDFLLSRIGTEPAREQLLAFVMRGTGAESTETPGLYNLVSLRAGSWDAFVAAVAREHGGFEGYAQRALGFSREDLEVVKKNLRG